VVWAIPYGQKVEDGGRLGEAQIKGGHAVDSAALSSSGPSSSHVFGYEFIDYHCRESWYGCVVDDDNS
jgi:hypothetical protein